MPKIIVTDHAPRVWVIGASMPVAGGIASYLAYRRTVWRQREAPAFGPEDLIEFGGRVCYDSWHNPADKTRGEYIQSSIVAAEHGSVTEHPVLNFAVASLPRSTQLELVRHGDGTAFSFRSTRFVDNWLEIVVPPAYRDDAVARQLFLDSCRRGIDAYTALIEHGKQAGIGDDSPSATLRRKRIREAARDVLPHALGSDGEVSVNARALRWIVHCRSDINAGASIREFAHAAYEAARPYFPSLFADATVSDDPSGTPQIAFAHPKI